MRSRAPILSSIGIVILLLTIRPGICDEISATAFEKLVDNWRWSHYWFGYSGVDDVYVPGEKISALVFWTKKGRRPKVGLCSSRLSICAAYSGPFLNPRIERANIDPGKSLQQAFASFVAGGFGGTERYVGPLERLSLADFSFEAVTVTLPPIEPPASISARTIPAGARAEAQRLMPLLKCRNPETAGLTICSGALVFAFFGPADPYWFVLRTCSPSCGSAGESIEELTRGDRGWEVTSRGLVNSPQAEVDRLKRQILKAEMFRLEF
jgi:hypothetical protein